MCGFLKRRRRRKLRARPFPDAWREIIAGRVPHWALLDEAERRELEGHVQVLLHEKHWEGCGGLVLTDDMRLTIAAQAALLLLNRPTDYFPKLTSILVYPAKYVVETTRPVGGGVVAEGEEVRLGESWYRGALVLSWDDARQGAVNPHDSHNVVLHEFAHQLDAEWGGHEGAPLLPDRALRADWARICQREFERLQEDVRVGRRTVIGSYGATKPAEFFAVVTETYFENPLSLERAHSELYDVFRRYYQQDPGQRVRRRKGGDAG